MAFITEKHLEDSQVTYKLSPSIKKYTLMDTTFIKNKLGNYELTRILENVPNSGDQFAAGILPLLIPGTVIKLMGIKNSIKR